MNLRHQRLYSAIVAHIGDKGYAPTIRELIAMTDYTSTSMISYGLSVLRAAGWIDYVDGESRTITVTGGKMDFYVGGKKVFTKEE